jgi:DNA-binding transcriptional LysR family regulator
MLDQLRSMAVFARTVQTGSFRGAAKALGLSPSVVSHHVSQLEAALDVVLLYRTTRRISLTPEGERLYAAAQEMLSAAEGGLQQIAQHAKALSGRLTVAAPAVLAGSRLIDDLASFALAYPRVSLALTFSDAPVDLIGGGVDVAIRAGSLRDSSLKSKRLFTLPRALVASPGYVARRPPPKRPADLAEWEWIRLSSRPAKASFQSGGSEETVELRARLMSDSAEAMLQLARRGLGLAMLPVAVVEPDLRAGRLVEVLPEWRLEAPPVFAVWPANARRSGLGMRLISFLEERLRA